MTLQELYASRVRPLTPADRLRLASMILGDLTVEPAAVIDASDAWSDDDLADLSAWSAHHAEGAAAWEERDADTR